MALHIGSRSLALALALAATLAPACDRERDPARREAALALVRAIRAVRDAPHDQKAEPLRALRALTCAEDRCEAHGVCVRAYELHQGAIERLGAARKSPGSGAFSAESVALLEKAQTDLEKSVELSTACADAEGELVRRYALE